MVNLLDRLDRLGPVRFTLTLYVVRWLVLLPLMPLLSSLTSAGDGSRAVVEEFDAMPAGTMFLLFVLFGPPFETLVECAVPCLALEGLAARRDGSPVLRRRRRAGAGRRGSGLVPRDRPWVLVAVAAAIMVLLHPHEVRVIVPTAITGAFLGYTYGHLAARSHGTAFLATTLFHAGINLVGFAMFAWS